MTLILSNEEVEKLLDVKECIEVLEDAYREQAAGRAISQLRMDTEVPITEDNQIKEFEFKTMVGILPKRGIALSDAVPPSRNGCANSVLCGQITSAVRVVLLWDWSSFSALRPVNLWRFFRTLICRRYASLRRLRSPQNIWPERMPDAWVFRDQDGRRVRT